MGIGQSTCVLSSFSLVQLFVNPMDCSPPASPVHDILQARILEWVAMPSSRGSSQPRHWIHISYLLHLQVGSLPLAPRGKPIGQSTPGQILEINGCLSPQNVFHIWKPFQCPTVDWINIQCMHIMKHSTETTRDRLWILTTWMHLRDLQDERSETSGRHTVWAHLP